MRILLVGAGAVGAAAARIASRRDFFSHLVVADQDADRADRAASWSGDPPIIAARLDAWSAAEVAALCRAHLIPHVVSAVDPRFVIPIFEGAFAAGADYLDLAMSLSQPHSTRPHEECGVK